MGLENLVYICARKCIGLKRKRILKKVDIEICALHEEWEELNKNELKVVKGNAYAYKAFKNIYGGDIRNFVSDTLYQNVILPKLNFTNYTKMGQYQGRTYFSDKNYLEFFVKDIKPLECVIHKINGLFYNKNFERITKDETLLLLNKYDELVYKKSIETGHGKGVSLIYRKDYNLLLDEYDSDYVIQEVLKQHESLAYFNASSVNVIRITTLLWKGYIYYLGGVLRIGPPGSFCDLVANGEMHPLIIPIHENGELGDKAIDCDRGYIYDNVWGKRIKGNVLKYEQMKELVKREHMKYPNHGIIGWDLTLDENADIRCIEYNIRCPGIIQSQYALGPIFAQKSVEGKMLLDEILNE